MDFHVGISCGHLCGHLVWATEEQFWSNFVFGYKTFVWAFRVGISVGISVVISVSIYVGICVG